MSNIPFYEQIIAKEKIQTHVVPITDITNQVLSNLKYLDKYLESIPNGILEKTTCSILSELSKTVKKLITETERALCDYKKIKDPTIQDTVNYIVACRKHVFNSWYDLNNHHINLIQKCSETELLCSKIQFSIDGYNIIIKIQNELFSDIIVRRKELLNKIKEELYRECDTNSFIRYLKGQKIYFYIISRGESGDFLYKYKANLFDKEIEKRDNIIQNIEEGKNMASIFFSEEESLEELIYKNNYIFKDEELFGLKIEELKKLSISQSVICKKYKDKIEENIFKITQVRKQEEAIPKLYQLISKAENK